MAGAAKQFSILGFMTMKSHVKSVGAVASALRLTSPVTYGILYDPKG